MHQPPPVSLSLLSDADLIRTMARAGAAYPSREHSQVRAEAERRGIERIRAATHAVAVAEEGDATWLEPYCACGRRLSQCDGSRRGCVTTSTNTQSQEQ